MTEDGHYNSLIQEIHAFVTSFNFQSLSAESAENMLLAINKHIYIHKAKEKKYYKEKNHNNKNTQAHKERKK